MLNQKENIGYVILQRWINQKTKRSSSDEEEFTAMHFAAFNGNLKLL
jgi:hypothetical protein